MVVLVVVVEEGGREGAEHVAVAVASREVAGTELVSTAAGLVLAVLACDVADVSTDSDGDRTCGSCSSLISGNAY